MSAFTSGIPYEAALAQGKSAFKAGKYMEAERLLSEALKKAEAFGLDDERLLESLNSMAGFYAVRGEYAIAERLFDRALTVAEKLYGPDHQSYQEIAKRLGVVRPRVQSAIKTVDFSWL